MHSAQFLFIYSFYFALCFTKVSKKYRTIKFNTIWASQGIHNYIPSSWTVPVYEPDGCVWEPGLNPCHQQWFPPLHTHVLLLLQSFQDLQWFHLHHCPKDAYGNPNSQKSRSYWLPDTDVTFALFHRWHAPDCDALWQIWGRLSLSALYSSHEPSPLWYLNFSFFFFP